ncbi:MAG TPA: hypothetical protein VMC85_01040 [Desulfomonilaceae bacterium]|nr:hypothetical protein [Desulfomonilaceae bacterium]
MPPKAGETHRRHERLEASVKLVVCAMPGKEVSVLVSERKAPGSYEVTFDGSGLASGVYFYRLSAGAFMDTKQLLLVRSAAMYAE